MGLFDMKFDMKKETPTVSPEVAACDNELVVMEQRKREVYVSIGQRYASECTEEMASGTPYEAELAELKKIAERKVLLEKRRLAVQGMRKCENCGNVLDLNSAFCNQCGEKLEPLEPEVFTDGPLCPQCKSPIEPGIVFCTKCGARIGTAPQQPMQPDALQCPSCGAVCGQGTKFCVKCGTALGM